MSRKSYPNVNAANQYARDVARGKTEVGRHVREACQRHLDNLNQEKARAFKYRFDKDLAERAAKFIQLLPHTKGEWAFKRMPITLEPWQLFIVCSVFGWVHKGSRLRRFREVYTEIPRKNGKSAISAGVALYCFTCDDEFGAEVYSGATTEKQAWEVFRPARLMCKRTPLLTEAFGIEVNASNLNRPADGARFEPLIGNPGDGQSPSCAIVDEYHEHDMINDLEKATYSNISEQAIQFVRYTVMPWVTNWEQELNRRLFTRQERLAGFYVRFNLAGLLRGTPKERAEFYHFAITDGWMSRNEARAFEDMNPVEGLDDMLVSVNAANLMNNQHSPEQEDKPDE